MQFSSVEFRLFFSSFFSLFCLSFVFQNIIYSNRLFLHFKLHYREDLGRCWPILCDEWMKWIIFFLLWHPVIIPHEFVFIGFTDLNGSIFYFSLFPYLKIISFQEPFISQYKSINQSITDHITMFFNVEWMKVLFSLFLSLSLAKTMCERKN